MKILVLFMFLFVLIEDVYTLSLSDFVPNFLYASRSESASEMSVRPFVDIKRNASSSSTWYCTRMQNNVSNVFCDKEESAAVAQRIVYGNKNDNTRVVDNALSTNDSLTQSMSQRTSTFQDPKVTNLLLKDQDQIQNSALIPLQPAKDVHMGVNAQQVEFNIQY